MGLKIKLPKEISNQTGSIPSFEFVTYLLFLHHFKHFLHVCVCLAVHRAAMYVVTVLSLVHDKNTYVGHRAQIHKVPDLVLKESLVEQGEK